MSKMLVLLHKRVVVAVHAARARHHPNETGGFLIGLRRGINMEVTSLTQQAKGDIATPTSFERAAVEHRNRIHAIWRSSSGFETLVGDWHSHPRGLGAPSWADRKAWRTLARGLQLPVVGLIDSGGSIPSLYLATGSRLRGATRLLPCEEDLYHLAFA